MIKTLILVRHGESQKDKNNPKRKLTLRGRRQIQKTANKLAKILGEQNGLIITTKTKRTRMSAKILSRTLGFEIRETQLNLRVSNFELLEKKYGRKNNLVKKYFKDFENRSLSQLIDKPTDVAVRFLRLLGLIENEVVILVGHGAALESFATYQDVYTPIKKFNRELGYGEFIVLVRD